MDKGRWNDIDFGEQEFSGIADSFSALGLAGRVPLKFGHGEGEKGQPFREGMPALGWVSRVWVDGTKLMADFTDLPRVVYDAIKKNLYRFVSVELLKNVQAGTRKIPWVLDAVALLGADQPAVGSLKDLKALTMTRKPVFQAHARVVLRRENKLFSKGAKKAMEDTEFQAALDAALDKQAKALRVEFTAEVKKVTDAAKAESDAAVAKAKAEAHRAQIKAKFETAVKAEALLPAKRESFYKFNRVDDDKSVIDIKLEDVDAYIEEFSDKEKLAAANKTQTKGGGEKVVHAATNALEITRRTEETVLKRGEKVTDFGAMHAATKIVLSADPKLAKAYFADPNGAFSGEAA